MSDNEKSVGLRLEGNPDGVVAALNKVRATASSTFDGMTGAVNSLGAAFTGSMGIMATFAAFAAGGKLFGGAITTTQEVVGEIQKLSKTLGISAEQASVLRIALDDAFLTADDMTAGASRLTKQLLTNEDAFKNLGVQTRDSNGHYRDTVGIMLDVNSKLKDLKEGTDQNVAGMSIYGRSWQEVRGLMKLTNGAMTEARERAERLHLIFGDEGIKQVREYKGAMKDLDDVTESIKVSVGRFLIPALTELAVSFGDAGVTAAGAFANKMHDVQAELIRVAMLADKAGGSLTAMGYYASGGKFTSAGRWFGQQNEMYAKRYAAGDKELQRLAYLEVGLDENGNPIKYDQRKPDKPLPGNFGGGKKEDIAQEMRLDYYAGKVKEWVARTNEEEAIAKEMTEDYLTSMVHAWVKASNEIEAIQKEMAENDSDPTRSAPWLNYFGKMSADQQNQFDTGGVDLADKNSGPVKGAMGAYWEAARQSQIDKDLQMTAEFNAMKAQLDGDSTQMELLRIKEEESAWLQSWAMQTSSFEEFERRKTLIQQRTVKQMELAESQRSRSNLLEYGQYTANAATLFNNLYEMTGKKNRAMFYVAKGMAMANTAINTSEAVMKTYAQTGIFGGPVAAALVAAVGATQMGLIASQSPEGGGATGSFGGGTPTSPIVTQPLGSGQQQPVTNITIEIQGNMISDDKWVEDKLAPLMRDLAVNRNVNFGLVPKG